MPLSITSKEAHVLTIEDRLSNSSDFEKNCFIVFIVSLIFTGIFALTQLPLWIYSLNILVVSVFLLLAQYELRCIINKHDGSISYRYAYRYGRILGILSTQFKEQNSRHRISEIQGLEMQKHIRRFQIRLVLNSGQKLNLSAANLKFSDCQSFAEQIRSFLELETQPKAVY